MRTRHPILASLFLIVAACDAPSGGPETDPTSEADLLAGRAGAVFVMGNEASGNLVHVFRRAGDGTLQRAASHATTGLGSGDGLGSQGALTFSTDGRFLFAVNAGSNELSVFRVGGENLYLVDVVPTGGVRPVSVTEHAGVVYVVHGGDGMNGIAGFRQGANGTLAPLAGSTHALSQPTTGPAQVSFSPSGRALIVTEKMTNKVDEFRVDGSSGRVASLDVHDSAGMTPFGFSIDDRGHVIVSEAQGGAAGASTLSSYQLAGMRGLDKVSARVASGEGAACWVVLGGDRAFVSNTMSGSISTYHVAYDGTVTLEAARAAVTGEGSKPTDMALDRRARHLYTLESGTQTLGIVRVREDGSLEVLADVPGLPASAAGVAAL